MTYAFDPARAPDEAFDPGRLHHLVPGNRARMLDPRRTPVRIVALRPEVGRFTCQVLAFEDRGARWDLTLESVAHFQFEKGCDLASPETVGALEAAVARFDRPLEIGCEPGARARTLARLDALRGEAGRWLESHSRFVSAGAAPDLGSLEGDPRLAADLRDWLEARGSLAIEAAFARGWVSHPDSGEIVQGHRVVLAELGLSPYRGRVLRDPASLQGAWDRDARAAHVLHRMAFVHACFERMGLAEVTLWRGGAGDRAAREGERPGLLSASFSREVAEAVLGPPDAPRAGRTEERRIASRRLFMTYLETAEMNRPFREAEAVLVVGEEGSPFTI